MDTAVDRDRKISPTSARAKMVCFAIWLIPFVMSAFSERR
jgi:hypothetical protein